MEKLASLFVLLSLLGLLQGQGKTQNVSGGDDEQAVRQVEEEEGKVWTLEPSAAAIATIDRTLGDDFVCICDGAEVTKKQAIADFKSGDSKVESTKLGEMKIRFFGEVAVVTGSDDRKGSYKGKDISGHYVWTDVLVKRQGNWQEVAAHLSR